MKHIGGWPMVLLLGIGAGLTSCGTYEQYPDEEASFAGEGALPYESMPMDGGAPSYYQPSPGYPDSMPVSPPYEDYATSVPAYGAPYALAEPSYPCCAAMYQYEYIAIPGIARPVIVDREHRRVVHRDRDFDRDHGRHHEAMQPRDTRDVRHGPGSASPQPRTNLQRADTHAVPSAPAFHTREHVHPAAPAQPSRSAASHMQPSAPPVQSFHPAAPQVRTASPAMQTTMPMARTAPPHAAPQIAVHAPPHASPSPPAHAMPAHPSVPPAAAARAGGARGGMQDLHHGGR